MGLAATVLIASVAFVAPPRSLRAAASLPSAAARRTIPVAIDRNEAVEELQEQLKEVTRLVQDASRRESEEQPVKSRTVSGTKSSEPSFTRLFTHETWAYYTGKPPLERWFMTTLTWRFSTVLANVWPVCVLFAIFGSLIARLPPMLLPRINPFPLSLQGTAIGLLLVFRTNNSYLRLSEARELWGRAIVLCREVAQGMVIGSEARQGKPSAAALQICRYLTGFGYELAAKFSSPPTSDSDGDAVLHALLSKREADFLCTTRSRPVALIRSIRRVSRRAAGQ